MSILKEFPAYAGMITSDSGGRTVIDKFFGTSRRGNVDPVWDSGTAYTAGQYVWFPDKDGDIYRALEDTSAGESPDTHSAKWDSINAEWSGNDRPELHQTLEGKYQACVEKETTNNNGDAFASNVGTWNLREEEDYNISSDDPIKYGSDSVRIDCASSPSSAQRVSSTSAGLLSWDVGDTVTLSVLIRTSISNPAEAFELDLLSGAGGGTANPAGITNAINYGNGIYYIYYTFNVTDATASNFSAGLRWGAGVFDVGDFVLIDAIQSEKSAYPTLFTEGTRPAPLVPIDNFLPDTGTVGWVGEMVRGEETTFLIDSGGTTTTDRTFLLYRGATTNDWRFTVYGSTGGEIDGVAMPFALDQYDRMSLIGIGSWSASNTYLWLCDLEGNLYRYTSIHAINDNTLREVSIGSRNDGDLHNSIRTANFKSGTDIIDTAEKAAELIEELTKGSYNLKASEITLMN